MPNMICRSPPRSGPLLGRDRNGAAAIAVTQLSSARRGCPYRKGFASDPIARRDRRNLCAPEAPLLFEGPLCCRDGLESPVRDLLAAFDGKSVCAGGEASLCAFDGGELHAEVLGTTSGELILIEVLGIHVARFPMIGRLQRAFALKGRESLLDPRALTGQQLTCTTSIHAT
jgi:hypothetical protein